LKDVKTIRSTLGGSVNDVLLAAIAGAFRSILLERGDDIGVDDVMRSLVPVSVRMPGDHTLDNQVSLIIAELPIGIVEPVARLESVCAQMNRLKASHQATAGVAVLAAAASAPPALLAFTLHATAALLRTTGQQSVNTVTTNVAGPGYPLYALGREMLEYLPFVPLSQGVRIGVAIMSYNGHIAFGITGDYDSAPDVHAMAEQVETEIAVLLELAAEQSNRGTS
jgi:diacylglycerol O-acyltransferase